MASLVSSTSIDLMAIPSHWVWGGGIDYISAIDYYATTDRYGQFGGPFIKDGLSTGLIYETAADVRALDGGVTGLLKNQGLTANNALLAANGNPPGGGYYLLNYRMFYEGITLTPGNYYVLTYDCMNVDTEWQTYLPDTAMLSLGRAFDVGDGRYGSEAIGGIAPSLSYPDMQTFAAGVWAPAVDPIAWLDTYASLVELTTDELLAALGTSLAATSTAGPVWSAVMDPVRFNVPLPETQTGYSENVSPFRFRNVKVHEITTGGTPPDPPDPVFAALGGVKVDSMFRYKPLVDSGDIG